MNSIEKNKKYSKKYMQKINPLAKIPLITKQAIKKSKIIIDLGCGDGQFIHSLDLEYKNKKIIGVDISSRRIKRLKLKFPNYKFLCKDVCKTGLKKKSCDMIVCTQVIEHLTNDKKLIKEINDILKKRGYLYISSVIRKPYAIYKYRNKGKFVLDPTHEKEYKNTEEFLDLFKKNFHLIKYEVFPVKRKIFGIHIRIPRYYIIEGLWKKK
jgi:2-polyprenyl-3-methyl-5-hydroxy-6-metoxy-1,4-benzoquinol methylase